MDANKLENIISGYGINADDAAWLRALAQQPAAAVPEPAFRLTWRDGQYRVSKPNIGDTDCYTAEQVRAIIAAPPAALAVPEGYAEAIKAVQEMMPPRDFRPSAQVWLTGNQVNELHARLDAARGGAVPAPLHANDVQWIVNDIAELGVMIRGQAFFLYKGGSLVYEDPTHEDDGRPMMFRPVFKREFGECCHPINYRDPSRFGKVSLDDSDEWKPLPAAMLAQQPAAAVSAANVAPMRQPRADLARLVESINAAVYANGDGLSVTEAIGALELAKLELLKEQEQ